MKYQNHFLIKWKVGHTGINVEYIIIMFTIFFMTWSKQLCLDIHLFQIAQSNAVTKNISRHTLNSDKLMCIRFLNAAIYLRCYGLVFWLKKKQTLKSNISLSFWKLLLLEKKLCLHAFSSMTTDNKNSYCSNYYYFIF